MAKEDIEKNTTTEASASENIFAEDDSARTENFNETILSPDIYDAAPLPYIKMIREYIVTEGITDIHLTEGKNISFRSNGEIITVPVMLPEHGLMQVSSQIFHLQAWDKIDCPARYENKRLRLRSSQSLQRRQLIIRILPDRAPTLKQIGYDAYLSDFIAAPITQGIVIVAGATGSGKSTLLAGILQQFLDERPIHLITAEYPAEYEFFDSVGIVSQRELPDDAGTFYAAVVGMLREDPDVILIGETNDKNTAEATLQAAETGHLAFTTLHAPDIPGVIGRMMGLLTETDSPEIRLSNVLKGCIYLRHFHDENNNDVREADFLWFDDDTKELVRDKTQYYKLKDYVKTVRISHNS